MAQVNVIGRITADLELKTSEKSNPYVRFDIAENIGSRQTLHTQYFQVCAWGEDANRLMKAHAKKGSLIWVTGSLELEPYTKRDGKQKNGCTDSADDILWNMAELKELSPGFHVFVLRTVNDSGMCGMLRDDRCTIYSVRPHTCRLYPFTAEPCPEEHRIKWYLCTEQPHHFGLGSVTAREWQRKNMSDEDEAFWFDECRILPELGKLLRSVPENNFQRAEQLIVAYRYLAYDFDQPFLPQYRDNMLFLKAMLEKLA